MALAWLSTVGLCVLQLVMMKYGAGLNVWDVPAEDLKTYLKVGHTFERLIPTFEY